MRVVTINQTASHRLERNGDAKNRPQRRPEAPRLHHMPKPSSVYLDLTDETINKHRPQNNQADLIMTQLEHNN